jgi:hypothetical protein
MFVLPVENAFLVRAERWQDNLNLVIKKIL